MEILGHSQIAVTMNVARVTSEEQRQAMMLMDQLLDEAGEDRESG